MEDHLEGCVGIHRSHPCGVHRYLPSPPHRRGACILGSMLAPVWKSSSFAGFDVKRSDGFDGETHNHIFTLPIFDVRDKVVWER